MASNIAVLLIAFSTVLFGVASFRTVEEYSFDTAVMIIAISGLAWAVGSTMNYFFAPLRQLATRRAIIARWSLLGVIAIGMCAWPWFTGEKPACMLSTLVFFCAGMLIPSISSLKIGGEGELRDAFAKALVGAAFGAAFGAALLAWAKPSSIFPIASAILLLAPAFEPRLFLSEIVVSTRRWLTIPLVLIGFGLAFVVPDREASDATIMPQAAFGLETVFQFRPERKFDVYGVGPGLANQATLVKPSTSENSIRSFYVSEKSGRRNLARETRRFDLILVGAPPESSGKSDLGFGSVAEGTVTVEGLRLYFDRLKDDGFLQILGHQSGAAAQSTLASIAEAWKKSARADVDLHAVAMTSDGGKAVESVVVRMKPFSREEREKLISLFKDSKNGEMASAVSGFLVSDSSGTVVTDNRLFVSSTTSHSSVNQALIWITLLILLALIIWIAGQERRKGVASRWQTASIATYFAGLGISFAFFFVFFVFRAIRGWGMPSIAAGLSVAALFISLAAGAVVFGGRSRRRYGVRIQPLAFFVFAALFTYIVDQAFAALTSASSEWLAAFIGCSILIPFGLMGGSFFPNALEEASEKLAPRVLSLLWSLYAAGTALGIILASWVGVENGLDAVFVAGLFSFAWVAIFSGLVRPWNVRKLSTSAP